MAKRSLPATAGFALALVVGFAGCASAPQSDEQRPAPFLKVERIGDLPGLPGSGDTLGNRLSHALAGSRQVLVVGLADTSQIQGESRRPSRRPQEGHGGAPGGPGGGGFGGGPGGGGFGRGPGEGEHANGESEHRAPLARYSLVGDIEQLPASDSASNVRLSDTSSQPLALHDLLRAHLRLVSQGNGRAIWKGAVEVRLDPHRPEALDSALTALSQSAVLKVLDALRNAPNESTGGPGGPGGSAGGPPPQR